jgi:predicted nucleic acid-binding protein
VVLDSGAVSFLAGRSARAQHLLAGIRHHRLIVLSVTLVECLPLGGRAAVVNRFLRNCTVTDVPETLARDAARLRGLARAGSAADALVVAAAQGRAGVITGDRADLNALAAHARDVTVIAI